MNDPSENSSGVTWGFDVDENDEDGGDSVSANENGFATGLLTQPCDESVQSNESEKNILVTECVVESKSAHKSSVSKAANMRSLLNDGENEPGSTIKPKSKRLFADTASDSEDSSISDEYESTDDSSVEENKELTPIQVRRARNIERHNAFAQSLNLGALGTKKGSNKPVIKFKPKATQSKEICEDDNGLPAATKKRRGMIFSTTQASKIPRVSLDPVNTQSSSITCTKTAVQMLEAKYPGRSLQIKLLSCELEKVVRLTKNTWQSKSPTEKYYSEAKSFDDVNVASPMPILISGAGGSGKTSVVCDTINMLREKIDNISDGKSKSQTCKTNIISYAYVDCASAAGIDAAFVLNSAFKQLHGCYHPKSKYTYKHNNSRAIDGGVDKMIRPEKQVSLPDISILDYEDGYIEEDQESGDEEEEEQLGAEDLIEQERKQFLVRKKESKRQSLDKAKTVDRNSSERSVKFRRDARQSIAAAGASNAITDIKLPSRLYYDSSPVALFGRAVSMLLQGGLSRKYPKYGRCAILVLDNAERIKAWSKTGSHNALAQLFKMPIVMGVNITIIFISRDSLLTHSCLAPFKSVSMISDAAHPINIHFNSYSNFETMKRIFQTPRIQQMITGHSYSSRLELSCSSSQYIKLNLQTVLYKSMIHSFLQVADSYISDVAEVVRLSRMLWSEFINIFDNQERCKEYQELVLQVMSCLRNDGDNSYPICTKNECSLCNRSSEDNVNLNHAKGKMLEKLHHNVRETVRDVLGNVLMMPGRVVENKTDKAYAERLPYTTKFLLLAAFLCQQKRPEQDVNLFTTINTGKRSSRGAKAAGEGAAFASSASDLKQLRVAKIPSFQIERLLSVFTSIMGQYGRTARQAGKVADMGTDELFKIISSLIAVGLLRSAGNSSGNRLADKTDFIMEKVICTLSKEEAQIIASSVGFPLDKYCIGRHS